MANRPRDWRGLQSIGDSTLRGTAAWMNLLKVLVKPDRIMVELARRQLAEAVGLQGSIHVYRTIGDNVVNPEFFLYDIAERMPYMQSAPVYELFISGSRAPLALSLNREALERLGARIAESYRYWVEENERLTQQFATMLEEARWGPAHRRRVGEALQVIEGNLRILRDAYQWNDLELMSEALFNIYNVIADAVVRRYLLRLSNALKERYGEADAQWIDPILQRYPEIWSQLQQSTIGPR